MTFSKIGLRNVVEDVFELGRDPAVLQLANRNEERLEDVHLDRLPFVLGNVDFVPFLGWDLSGILVHIFLVVGLLFLNWNPADVDDGL